MPIDTNALGSIAASLEDLNKHLSELIQSSGEDDDSIVEILEVERHLETSARRLTQIMRKLT